MEWIVRVFLNALGLLLVAYLVPGIEVETYSAALLAAVVLGIVNALLRPVLLVLTLPVTILTLGVFALVINALLLLLVANIIPGFAIHGFWPAFWGGLWLWVVSWISNSVAKI